MAELLETIVFGNVKYADGSPWANAVVEFQRKYPLIGDDEEMPEQTFQVEANGSGYYSTPLETFAASPVDWIVKYPQDPHSQRQTRKVISVPYSATPLPVASLITTTSETLTNDIMGAIVATIDAKTKFARVESDEDFTDDSEPVDSTLSVDLSTGVYGVDVLLMSGGNTGALSNTGDAVFVPTLFLEVRDASLSLSNYTVETDFESDTMLDGFFYAFKGIIRVTTAGSITFAFSVPNPGDTLTIKTDSYLRFEKLGD